MSAPKWTPGPWLLDGSTIYTLDEHTKSNRWWASVQAIYRGPATERPLDITRAEISANARLIASAPELYHALNELVWCHDHPTLDSDDPEWTTVLAVARAALAKAKGATP
jgi:hypothetical protein